MVVLIVVVFVNAMWTVSSVNGAAGGRAASHVAMVPKHVYALLRHLLMEVLSALA